MKSKFQIFRQKNVFLYLKKRFPVFEKKLTHSLKASYRFLMDCYVFIKMRQLFQSTPSHATTNTHLKDFRSNQTFKKSSFLTYTNASTTIIVPTSEATHPR